MNLLHSDRLKSVFFELGAHWYARKLASGPEMELRREFIDWLAPSSGARVLDVGCGPGHLARLLVQRGCRVTATDRSRRLLRLARRLVAIDQTPVRFVRAAAERLPFADGSFDLSVATTVVYLVPQPESLLREMARVTRTGGTVASLDPSDAMQVRAMRSWAAAERLSARDTRKLVLWALAAERIGQRFPEATLLRLFAAAGLAEVQRELRLGGMVWFARAIKPSAG
ncbi:MAG: methyltransferase domain-containing protein [Firmicutes bacterium]|nr:methyltransferase domain-containing protein [Bacillota bacterium]